MKNVGKNFYSIAHSMEIITIPHWKGFRKTFIKVKKYSESVTPPLDNISIS